MRMRKGSIIGIAGAAGSGKSTFAGLLRDALAMSGEDTQIMAFADPLRAMMLAAFGEGIREALFGPSEMREQEIRQLKGVTVRRAMQTLGTEWGRALDPEIWVKITMAEAVAHKGGGAHVIIQDVRFLNELEAVTSRGGVVFRLHGRASAGAESGHASETEGRSPEFMAGCVHIDNSGDGEALWRIAQRYADRILEGWEGWTQ